MTRDSEERTDLKSLRESMLSSLSDMSSHPSRLGRRARLYTYTAALPAVVLIAGFLILLGWSFLEPEAGIRMLLRTGMFLRFLVPLFGFFAGFAATGLLVLLSSKAGVRFRMFQDEDGRGIAWLAVSALGVAAIGMALINYSGDGRIEILGHVLMVLPFVGTISALVVVAERHERRPLWWVAGVLPIVVFGLIYLSVLTGSGTRWVVDGLESRIGPTLERLRVDGLLGDLEHTIRALTAVVAFAGLGIWAILWRPWEPAKEQEQRDAPQGLLQIMVSALVSLVRWLKRCLGLVEEQPDQIEAPRSATWLTAVITEELEERDWFLPGGKAEVDSNPLWFIRAERGLPQTDRHPVWGSLFLDAPVTSDQVNALEEFIGIEGGSIERSRRPGVLPDVLIEAEAGGGGVETLAAAGIATVLLRGQGALFLVPDDESLDAMRRRILKVLEYNLIDGLVACGSLRDRKGIASDGKAVPQILVGTLGDLESAFFDSSLDDGGRRTLLGGFGGVFVASLMEFDPEQRLEVSLVLHKLRVLHISLRSWIQSMVLTDPLPSMPAAVDGIAGALFSKTQSHRGTVLRRRWAPEARVAVPILTGDSHVAFASAAAEMLRNAHPDWARVIVVMHAIPAGDAQRLASRIRGMLPEEMKGIRIDVVGSIGGFEEIAESHPADWVLVVEDHRPESCALAAELDIGLLGSRVAWASLCATPRSRTQVPRPRALAFPILGGSTTQGHWIRHAATLIELLEPLAPIERSDWGQFGLPRNGEIPTLDELHAESKGLPEDVAVRRMRTVTGFELDCDRRDRDPEAVRGAAALNDGNVWSWVARPRSAGAAQGLSLDPERDHRLVLLPGGTKISVVATADPVGRIATWHADAVDIPWRRPFDLAREARFLKRFDQRLFAPESLARDAEDRVRVEARSYPVGHLSGAMRHPVWTGEVDLTVHAEVEERHVRAFGLQDGLLVEFRARGRNRIRARTVKWALRGLVSDEGGHLPVSLPEFQYLGGVSVLCLGMGGAEKISAVGLPGGRWTTHAECSEGRRFDARLSASLQDALSRRAPGIERLGRLLVFHLKGGGSVVLIIEPWDSMKTVTGVLSVLFAEDAFRSRICRDARRSLKRILELEQSEGLTTELACCVVCGVGFASKSDDNPDDEGRRSRVLAMLEQG